MSVSPVVERFPSFDSMRATHSQLIKQYSLDAISDSEDYVEAVQDFLNRGQATGALLDSNSERESAQTMLDYWSTRLYRLGKGSVDALLDDFNADLAPQIPDELCPYRGLNAFNEDDSAIFFGRQKVIDEMVARIAQNCLLAVVGPSGSGKSSIVRAGLLPILKRGAVENSQDWVYIPIFVPSSRPLANLLVALNRASAGVPDEELSKEEGEALAISDEETSAFVANSNHLLEQIQQRFQKNVVITIDQFEEIFTLCDNESIRRAFVENLLAVIQNEGLHHRVVVTMRLDFESKLALYPDLQQAFENNILRLTPLTAADLRQAIEEPARKVGLKFEEGLIDNLLNDILGEPAALPLLQFTLLKLWEHRDRNRISLETYKNLGGGRQALANSADEFYNSLIPEDQVTARRILLRLVRPGEGMEVTSQRMRRLDLYTKSDATDRIDRVLQKYLEARLLRLTRGATPYDDQIEVAHEALVRNWPTLVAWLEDEREAIRQRRRLTVAAERWNELGCSPDLLLRGVELEEALRYDDLNTLESSFLQASQQARADEIEQAKKTVAELRKRNRIITAASVVAVVVALIAVLLGWRAVANSQAALIARGTAESANNAAQTNQVVAEIERENADFQRENAQTAQVQALQEKATAQAANTQIVAQQTIESALIADNATKQASEAQAIQVAFEQNIKARARQLADQARSLVSRQTDLGVLLGLEAANLGETLADQGVLLDVLRANPNLKRYLHQHTGAVNDVAYSPDGQLIASAGEDQNLVLWFTEAGQEPVTLTPGSISGLNSVDFSPNNDQVAAGGCIRPDRIGACGAGLLTFWELTSGNYATTTMEVHRGEITALEFDPSGQRIATGGKDGVVYLWRVPPTGDGVWSAKPLSAFTGQVGTVRSLAFTPNGRFLVTSSESTILIVRNLVTGEIPAFPIQKTFINAMAFSPDGRFLATGGENGNIYIYEMSRSAQVGEPLSRHTYAVTGLDFSPDGTSLVSSSEDGTVIQWNLDELIKSGRLSSAPASQVLQGHTDAVLSVAYGPDNQNLVSGGRDSAVIQWQIPAPYPLATNFISSADAVTGLGFSEDLIVSRSNGVVDTWDLDTGIQSGGEQWVQTGDAIHYPPTISQVFVQAGGQLVGLQNNLIQKAEVRGVDVSQNEGEVNWSEVKAAGFQFAFVAATAGITDVDPLFEQNWAGMGEAGLIRGAYHIFTPADDPLEQANHFAKTIPWEPGDLPPVVIVQDTQDQEDTEFLLSLQDFLIELENLTGRKPIVYTSAIFWQSLTETQATAQQLIPVTGGSSRSSYNASEYLLWVADYTTASQPILPTGWGTWTFWQYTNQGNALDDKGNIITETHVPGIEGSVYLNRFNGSLQALQSLANNEPPVAADPGVESTVLVDLETNEAIGESLPLLNAVSAALHPSGNLLAIGSQNGSITFWDLESGDQTEQVLIYSTAPVQSLAFDPQGRLLAAGSADGNIVIWDLEEPGTSPLIFTGHSSRVTSLAFGGKGNVLASGSADGSIILWDMAAKNPVGQPFYGPNSSVSALSINSEETLLAVGFTDGSVLIWDIDVDSWKQKVCLRAGRSLNQLEWDKYMTGMEYHPTCP